MQCHVISRLSKLSLQSTSIRQQTLEIALDCLKIRVSSNVLLLDVDVGDRSLAVDLLQCGLDGRSIIDLIKLDGVVVCAELSQKSLCGLAVRAV